MKLRGRVPTLINLVETGVSWVGWFCRRGQGLTMLVRVERAFGGVRRESKVESVIATLWLLSTMGNLRIAMVVRRREVVQPHSDTTVARMLVGNKCDLENIRDVSVEEGKSLAEAEGLFFLETSALDSTNVKKAFEIVIREIYNNVSRKVLNSDSYKAELSVNRVSLVKDGADGSKRASCCS
ncbi:hypothetical protein U1Q18_051334 [Sarracenia purpurea var. burkii]